MNSINFITKYISVNLLNFFADSWFIFVMIAIISIAMTESFKIILNKSFNINDISSKLSFFINLSFSLSTSIIIMIIFYDKSLLDLILYIFLVFLLSLGLSILLYTFIIKLCIEVLKIVLLRIKIKRLDEEIYIQEKLNEYIELKKYNTENIINVSLLKGIRNERIFERN